MPSSVCVYCAKPAVGIDLCHARHPVCAEHAHGHQLAELPKPRRT